MPPYTRLEIYQFDHCLFATPLPNRELLTEEFRDKLLDKNGGIDWYRMPEVFTQAGKRLPEDAKNDTLWNRILLDINKSASQDPHTLAVLLCNRPMSRGLIASLGKLMRRTPLEFQEVVYCQTAEQTVQTIAKQHPSLRDVSIYTTSQVNEETMYVSTGTPLHINVVACPFLTSRLNPSDEIRILADHCTHNANTNCRIGHIEGPVGTVYHLTELSSQTLLGEMLSEGGLIPEHRQSKYDYLGRRVLVSPWRTHIPSPEVVNITVTHVGHYKDLFYAVKVKTPISLEWGWRSQVVVIAKLKVIKENPESPQSSFMRTYVNEIAWEPVPGLLVLEGILGYDNRIGLVEEL